MYGLLEISDSSGKILASNEQDFDIIIKENQLYLSNFKKLKIKRKGKLHGFVIRDPVKKGLLFSFPITGSYVADIGEEISIYPVYAKLYPEN